MKRAAKRRKHKPVTLAPMQMHGDMGATGRANQANLVTEPRGVVDPETGEVRNHNSMYGKRRCDWIEVYAKQGKITREQQAAASRLYNAYMGNPDRDPIAAIGEPQHRSHGGEPLVAVVDSRREFYAMWEHIPTSSRPIVQHVVLEESPIRSIAGCSNGASHERHRLRLCVGLDAIP